MHVDRSLLQPYELGFHLDLDALRLVQFSLDEEAVWMTERDKLIAKSMGRDHLDMCVESFNLSDPTLSSTVLKPNPSACYLKNGGLLTPTQIRRSSLG